MKNGNKILLSGLALSLILSSCSVEKRLHNPGHHVSWKNSKHADRAQTPTPEKENTLALKPVQTIDNAENKLALQEIVLESTASSETLTANQNIEEAAAPTKRETEKRSVVAQKDKRTQAVEVKTIAKQKQKQLASKKVQQSEQQNNRFDDTTVILLYVLCFLLPVIAVGIVTDWELLPVLLSILLMLLFFIPAIIHGIIVVSRNT